jgi:CheY-like chemotaxis protein
MSLKRILVIDDEEIVTRTVKMSLEKTGFYAVRGENKARNALATAREFKPDLIFLDVMMPEMDGGEVAFQIKSDPQLKEVPMVFLTAIVTKKEASGSDQIHQKDRYLAKPVNLDELVQCIKQCVK